MSGCWIRKQQKQRSLFFDSGLTQRALESPPPPQLCRLASGVRVARGYRAFVDASCSQSFGFWLDSVRQPLPGVAQSEQTDLRFAKHRLTGEILIIASMIFASGPLRSARAAICLRSELQGAELP